MVFLYFLSFINQDMQPMPMPYYSSTTALYDSTERLNRLNEQYGSYRSGSGHKVPLDVSQDWDGYLKTYSRDRDSGLVRNSFPAFCSSNVILSKQILH